MLAFTKSNLHLWISYIFFPLIIAQGDPNASACKSVDAIVNICQSLTPGFTAFTNFYFQAPCLCYASTYWFPNGYDGWIQSCYSGYRTAQPAAYSSATASNGGDFIMTPCHKAGNILSAPEYTGAVTALVPSVPIPSFTSYSNRTSNRTTTLNAYESACADLGNAVTNCQSRTPGFNTLTDFRSQAPCYCYSGLAWNPQAYDVRWGSCIQYLSSVSPSAYSRASAAGAPVLTPTPCAAVGDILDIRNSQSSIARTSTPQTGPTQSAPTASSTAFRTTSSPISSIAPSTTSRTNNAVINIKVRGNRLLNDPPSR